MRRRPENKTAWILLRRPDGSTVATRNRRSAQAAAGPGSSSFGPSCGGPAGTRRRASGTTTPDAGRAPGSASCAVPGSRSATDPPAPRESVGVASRLPSFLSSRHIVSLHQGSRRQAAFRDRVRDGARQPRRSRDELIPFDAPRRGRRACGASTRGYGRPRSVPALRRGRRWKGDESIGRSSAMRCGLSNKRRLTASGYAVHFPWR